MNSFFNTRIIESSDLLERGDPVQVKRTWRERLFTLPWQPLKATRTEVPLVPSSKTYRLSDGTWLMHPNIANKIADDLRYESSEARWPESEFAGPTVANAKAVRLPDSDVDLLLGKTTGTDGGFGTQQVLAVGELEKQLLAVANQCHRLGVHQHADVAVHAHRPTIAFDYDRPAFWPRGHDISIEQAFGWNRNSI
jgi:hypothetical protein